MANDDRGADAPRERRLHLKAYHYWRSLLSNRNLPSIADMRPEEIADFRERSFLLDFPRGYSRPILRFVGRHIQEDHGGDLLTGRSATEISQESVLSRLTVHYTDVLAHGSPIGFEAGYHQNAGEEINYRGILLPFSDNDESIHFILGVLNWKSKDTDEQSTDSDAEPADGLPETSDAGPMGAAGREGAISGSAAELERILAQVTGASAEKGANPRARARLYDTLEKAYRMHRHAARAPEKFAELLKAAGIRKQARAPFTPILKLLLGKEYDKTRLTEYASALSYAVRTGQTPETVKAFIRSHPGGIKGCVQEERRARRIERGELTLDAGDNLRQSLRQTPARARTSLSARFPDEEFFLVLARRGIGEREIEIMDVLHEDKRIVEPILRRYLHSRSRRRND